MAKQVTSASSTLCAPIKISTTVPFIEQILDATDSKVPVQRPSTSKKIQVDVCSELSDYRAALEYFEKNGKIRMTYDEDAQPIIFTLDGDQVSIEPLMYEKCAAKAVSVLEPVCSSSCFWGRRRVDVCKHISHKSQSLHIRYHGVRLQHFRGSSLLWRWRGCRVLHLALHNGEASRCGGGHFT